MKLLATKKQRERLWKGIKWTLVIGSILYGVRNAEGIRATIDSWMYGRVPVAEQYYQSPNHLQVVRKFNESGYKVPYLYDSQTRQRIPIPNKVFEEGFCQDNIEQRIE